MADAKKDKKDEEKKYSMIPGKPAFIVGLLCAVIGFFQMYPEYRPDVEKWFDSGGAVASPTQPEKAPVPCEVDSEMQKIRALPKSSEAPLWIKKGADPTTIDLQKGVWSREINTPDDNFKKWDYQTIVEPGPDHFYIWFRDDTILKVSQSDKEFKEYGMRRGIFRILVEEENKKLTVKVQ